MPQSTREGGYASCKSMPWKAVVDAASGKTYYVDTVTKKTQWNKPEDFDAGVASPKPATQDVSTDGQQLPAPWVERTDPASGKVYFVNRETKETTWTRPQGAASTVTPPSLPVPAPNGGTTSSSVVSGVDAVHNSAEPSSAAATPVAITDLPEGWLERVDRVSGKTYYFNRDTRETSWVKPSTEPRVVSEPSEGDVASDWVEKVDPSSGKPYYYNRTTKETSWKKPPSRQSTPTPASSAQPSVPAASASEWSSSVDSVSGKTYFFNRRTKETRWTMPDEMKEAVMEPTGGDAANTPSKSLTSGATHSPSNGNLPLRSPPQKPQQPPQSVGSQSAAKTPVATTDTVVSGDWVRRINYRTGQYMYCNTVTGETQWTDPTAEQVDFVLPTVAETIYCIGGDERPSAAEKSRIPPGEVYSSVECLDGPQWRCVQYGYLDARKTQADGGSTRRLLLEDLEDVTALRISWEECLYFGLRIGDRMPVCAQWNCETGATRIRYDLQGLVAHGAAYATIPRGIIASGGFLDDTMKNVSADVMLLDLSRSGAPHLLPKLNEPRANHTMVVIDLSTSERLAWVAFVAGGFDGSRKLASVERYVLGKKHWELVSNMPIPRTGHCSVAVDRTIYVLGGRSGYRVLNEVDMVHIQSDIWRPVKPMHQARSNFGAVHLSSLLIVVGGWDGTKYLNSAEAYDPRIDVWRRVVSLPHPKQKFGMVVLRRHDATMDGGIDRGNDGKGATSPRR